MYKCDNCSERFDEPETEYTTYESYFGVSSLFPNSTPMTLQVCPYCGSEDIDEIERPSYDVYPGEPIINKRFKHRYIRKL